MRIAVPEPQADAEVPGLKGYPVVGVLPQFWRDPLSTLLGAALEHGDAARINLGRKSFLLLSHPDHVRHVLQNNARNYIKGYGKARVLFGNGLVLNEGDSWLQQRRLMQPAFHRERLAGFAETMVAETEQMLDRWDAHASAGHPLDIAQEMTLLSQRIIVKAMFGGDVGPEGEKIARAVDVAFTGMEVRLLMPLWVGRLPAPANRRFEEALSTVHEEVHSIIRRRRREADRADDLLSMLMEARDEETGERMSDQQLHDEILTIYLAGHETTARLLSWCWYLLSKNPESGRKVREEAFRVFGNRIPRIEDLTQLAYTRMVVEETSRLYPQCYFVTRKAVQDDEIGPYHIPAGSVVAVSPYVMHRRADLWENPEGFDPERFRPGAGEGRPRFAYFPFGGGPRLCIGRNFALMEAALVVAAVARRYRLDLVPGQHVKTLARGSLKPHPGIPMTLHAVTADSEADR